jgi:hypothetical protein
MRNPVSAEVVTNYLCRFSKWGKRARRGFGQAKPDVPKHCEIEKSTETYEYMNTRLGIQSYGSYTNNKNTKPQDVYKGTGCTGEGHKIGIVHCPICRSTMSSLYLSARGQC